MYLDAEATLESMNVIALDNKISSKWHLQTNDSGSSINLCNLYDLYIDLYNINLNKTNFKE